MKHFFTLAAAPLEGLELATFEGGLGQPSKDQMLQEFRAGTRHDVTFPARVYLDVPNKNHGLFKADELAAFAASFTGKPFLKDHSRYLDDRGGTIKASELQERNGVQAIIQTIHAVEPWAVKGYLAGTVDRFSIGWHADDALCSICGGSFYDESHNDKHDPWNIGLKDKESGKVLEVLWSGLEGVETSAVNTPAVPGTGVDESMSDGSRFQQVMSSHASGGQFRSAKAPQPKEIGMLQKLLSLLGLSAEATEPEAIAAVERLRSASSRPSAGLLSALSLGAEASENEAIGRILAFKGTTVPREEHDRVVKELSAEKAERLVRKYQDEGKVVPSNEAWARRVALSSSEEFERIMADYPVQRPALGAPPPADATAAAVIPNSGGLTADEEQVLAKSSLNREQFIAAKKRPAPLAN